LTATAPGAGGTTTTGRAGATTPAGGLATTVFTGGFDAIAGVGGGAIMFGPERGCGTMRRGGTGACGAAGGAAWAAGGAVVTVGLEGCACGVAGREGMYGWRASSSSTFFLARIAFITSPGLEMCDRSIFGVMVCWPRESAPLEDDAARAPP
jgi:hypothetical protein